MVYHHPNTHVSQIAYMNQIIIFLLEQFISKEKIECQAGLKPAPLTGLVSALTFRPPALYDLSSALALIQKPFVSDSMTLTLAHAHCYVTIYLGNKCACASSPF